LVITHNQDCPLFKMPSRSIRFDIPHMSSSLHTYRSYLLASCAGTLLTLSACTSEVKVQRIVYDPPSQVASADQQPDAQQEQLIETQTSAPALTSPEFAPLTTIEQVRTALEDIYDRDAELVAASLQEDPNRIHALTMIAEFDKQHAQTLETIIDRFGWPSRDMVGLKAVQGAYIAVQHADHDPEFQSECLALIKQQVDDGELPGAFLALMTDRVSLSRGDPQIYGTQMTMSPDEFGVMRAVPSAAIWKAELLDQRRSALGMPPHQRFIEAIELAYFDSVGHTQNQLSSVPTDD
jgi:uncharacterized protein DUF6624